MNTVLNGTFVIPWAQSQLDGQETAVFRDILAGKSWRWSGELTRIDGAPDVLPLGAFRGEVQIRARIAKCLQRFLGRFDVCSHNEATDTAEFLSSGFDVTDGRDTWTVYVIPSASGGLPLLMFHTNIPPKDKELWIIRSDAEIAARQSEQDANGLICFTPGTMISTPDGPKDVVTLKEGDEVTTRDSGAARILWLGSKHLSAARLCAMPQLAPVRLRSGSLGLDIPDRPLLVSPDHKVLLKAGRANALFNSDEVLVAARDLINGGSIYQDRKVKSVTYVHMMLPRHEIVFANGVATESFHPSCITLDRLDDCDRSRLFNCLPALRTGAGVFGPYARRVLSKSETALLCFDS